MGRIGWRRRMAAFLAAMTLAVGSACGVEPEFERAHEHLQKGRYAEASEALSALAAGDADPVRIALLRSRVLDAEGNAAEAAKVLQNAVDASPEDATLRARLAEVQFRQGRYDNAEQSAAQALRRDEKQPLARLVRADVLTERGQIDEALEGYRWLVRYYNEYQPTDAETLLVVGRGAARYARWKSSPQVFSFLVNTLAPDALRDDPLCWQAHHLAGGLLLEKYNRAQGVPELKKALAINPRASEVLVLLGRAAYEQHDFEEAERYADQTLVTNPHLVSALCLKADLEMSSGDLAEALRLAEQALAANPHDQRALARQAACFLLIDGPPGDDVLSQVLGSFERNAELSLEPPDRFTRLVLELARRNPRPGCFFSALGEILDGRWKFDLAERFYRTAMRVMPQLSEPKTALGMLYMRMGKTGEAAKLLDEAFAADPYHVRVSNTRKVLKVLDEYETIATDHFVIRFDSEADRILARYMAEYLEEIYPELTAQFGYEPPHRTHFELYHNAKGLAAHQWFSARMVGLPWVQTVGASTGMVVALASPTAAEEPFNWARVARHELVHVITLQQTGFNIPHWLTEALAVTAEGYPRPPHWNRLLRERVPKGELRTLKNLSDGFIRAESPDDWQFSYCQSRLYAEHMTEAYGADTIPKLLAAYRENLPTEEAIARATGVDLETFEQGYREYLNRLVADLPAVGAEPEQSLAEREREYRARPDDAAAMAAYAEGLLEAGRPDQARQLAGDALKKNPREIRAALVVAQLETHARNVPEAIAVLERAIDTEEPHVRGLKLLAQLKLLNGESADAVRWHESGRKLAPDDLYWIKGLAIAYRQTGETAGLKDVLQLHSQLDPDDVSPRKRLAEIALAERDFADAAKYARMALHIDVLDAEVHRILGEACRELGAFDRAVREFQIAVELDPEDSELRLGLAKSYATAKNADAARATVDELLKRKPDHAAAQELRKTIP